MSIPCLFQAVPLPVHGIQTALPAVEYIIHNKQKDKQPIHGGMELDIFYFFESSCLPLQKNSLYFSYINVALGTLEITY